MKNKISPEDKLNIDLKLNQIFISLINSKSNQISSSKYKEYHKLIENNFENQENITYIIHSLSKEIISLEKVENKIKILNLLKKFFTPLKLLNNIYDKFSLKYQLYCKYTSRILTVLQKIILTDVNPEIVSQTFGSVVNLLMSKKLINENDIKAKKKTFEIILGFCFYNMRQFQYNNQINGVLSMKELITKTDYYIKNRKHLKNLFEKIILLLDNDNFEPKINLFETFTLFIKKCGTLFEPYIDITLYKMLNFIEVNTIDVKRKIIDILYIILSEYSYAFIKISTSIINYLSLLMKKNNDPYINYKCKEILSFYNNFCFYSTFNKYKNKEKNNLFRTSKSCFYKTTNKKNDSYTSKSSKYNTSRKDLKIFGNKMFDFKTIQNKKDNLINNIFCYSLNYNLTKKDRYYSRTFSSKLLNNNKNKFYLRKDNDDNNKNHIFNYANSSLSKSTNSLNSLKILLY